MSCPFQAEKVSCSFPTIATLRSQPPKNPQRLQRVGHFTRIIPLVLLERSNKLANETWKFDDKSRMFTRFHIHNPRLGHLAMWMPDPIAGRLLDVHLSLDRRCPDMRIPDICVCSLLVSWWNPLSDRWLTVASGCIAVITRGCYSVFRCITNQNIPCLAVRFLGTSVTLQYPHASQNISLHTHPHINIYTQNE